MSEKYVCKDCNKVYVKFGWVKRHEEKFGHKIVEFGKIRQYQKKYKSKVDKYNLIKKNQERRIYQRKETKKQKEIQDLDFVKIEINMLKKMYQELKITGIPLNQSRYHDDPIERIKQDEAAKLTDPLLIQYRGAFAECITELKEVLKLRREQLEELEFKEIFIEAN